MIQVTGKNTYSLYNHICHCLQTKSPSPCPMGSEFYKWRTGHYVNNNDCDCTEENILKFKTFSLWAHIDPTQIHNFGKGLRGHQGHAFCIFPTCVKVEKTIFKDLIQVHYMVILGPPRSHGFQNFSRGLHEHQIHEHQIHEFNYLQLCGSWEEDFKRFLNTFVLYS